jgi:uncharacterized protein (TIGR03067 family)
LVALVFGLPLAFAQEPSAKEELKKLEGNWIQVAVLVDGKDSTEKTNAKDPSKQSIRIEGEKWIEKVAAAPRASVATFKIDPAKKPMHLDKTLSISGKSVTFPGIYTLEGDTLKVCAPFPFGGDFSKVDKRPTEFRGSVADGFVLIVYKRVKE